MTEKKLGYNIRVKAEKVNYEVFKEYMEIAKRADTSDLYYLGIPEFFARFDSRRLHSVPYMGAIATVTERVKFGPNVMEVPLLHPIHVADTTATLDIMSNGRYILGAGLGFWPSEYENFGIPWNKRGAILDESLDIIKKLLTEPAIYDYRGKFFTLKNVCSPPCIQKPNPPIWVGGGSEASMRRAAQYGNDWAPSWWLPGLAGAESMGVKKEFTWEDAIEKLREYCKKFNRELVLGRAPKGPKEVGLNMSGMNVNINPDREKAIEEARHFWVDVRQGRTQGAGSFEMKMEYAAVGNAEDVIEKLNEVYKTGAYCIVLYPITTDSKSQWDRLEKEVLPSL
jgi:alkanesulfonate monooxygenase SsuD/methylene tetrahydromethanopterin reductase-like flavin-dependent oxidoreductase (luciferase family)